MATPRTTHRMILGLWLLTTMGLWGFAFLEVSGANMAWLEAAKFACFGKTESGLPDGGGWILLTAAPLSFLMAIAVTWGQDIAQDFSRSLNNWGARALAGAIICAVLVQAVWTIQRIQGARQMVNYDYANNADSQLPNDYPEIDIPLPVFRLIDQSGQVITNQDLLGKPLLVTFAFAHCKTVCPAILSQSLKLLEELGRTDVELLIITLDPWRDTPSSLASFAAKWSLPKNAHVLSGEVEDVIAVLKAFNMPWERDKTNGDITHPALTYVVRSDGRIAYGFNNPPLGWLKEALARLDKNVTKN